MSYVMYKCFFTKAINEMGNKQIPCLDLTRARLGNEQDKNYYPENEPGPQTI